MYCYPSVIPKYACYFAILYCIVGFFLKKKIQVIQQSFLFLFRTHAKPVLIPVH